MSHEPADDAAKAATELAIEPVTEQEIREFLAADFLPERADPEFKARLREQLRAILLERSGSCADPPRGDPEAD